MKSLIRYLQNHLLMTNRPGYRKSSGSSPGTMIPPYHNFYSIWGHFSEDLLDFFRIMLLQLTKMRLSASGN